MSLLREFGKPVKIRCYETLFVLKPTLTQEELEAKVEFIKTTVTNNGGEIVGEKEMGMRPLAYKIGKAERGYYYVLYFKAPTNLITELERIYGITEDIIRFMNLKYESKKEVVYWEIMSQNKFSHGELNLNPYEGNQRGKRDRDRDRDRDNRDRDNK